MQQEWDERRDFFPALLVAQKSNQGKEKHERLTSAEDVLKMRYQPKQSDVMITDPDRGAGGDWRGLKSSLQATTAKAKAKRAQRPKPVMNA